MKLLVDITGGTSVLSPLSCSFFHFFLARFVAVVSICLIRILPLRPPVLQFQLPALLLVCALFSLFLLFVVVLSGEPDKTTTNNSTKHKTNENATKVPPWDGQ